LDKNQNSRVSSKIWFSFADNHQYEDCLAEFCFPNASEVSEYGLNDKNIQEIIDSAVLNTQTSSLDKNKFIFVLKGSEDAVPVNETLAIINPNRLLYCLCIKSFDFLVNRDSERVYVVEKVIVVQTYFPFFEFFFHFLANFVNYLKIERFSSQRGEQGFYDANELIENFGKDKIVK
jgi:hypothetical protein